MSFLLPCPNCGPRPVDEFSCTGEVTIRPKGDPTFRELTDYLYFRRNAAGVQRERGQCRGRRRRPPEEVNIHSVGRVQVLVDQDGDPAVGSELAQDLPDGTLPVDHRVAGAGPDPLQHVVQPGIVERPRQHGHRPTRQRMRDGVHFPVAEMSREEKNAAALLIRMRRALGTLALDARQHLLV